MKNERKEFDEQQTYLPKNSQKMINLSEQRDSANEANADDPAYDEDRYSKFPERTPAESDVVKHAQRLAVNYVRSLLLF